MTHNSPSVDGLTLTPSLITLPVETGVSSTSGESTNENSTYVYLSTIMLTTTNSIEIENDSHNTSNNEEGKSKSVKP